MQTQSAHEAL